MDGEEVSTQSMDRTISLLLPVDETFVIGADIRTAVYDHDYQVPFRFTGRIDKLTISIEPPKLTLEDVKKLEVPLAPRRTSACVMAKGPCAPRLGASVRATSR